MADFAVFAGFDVKVDADLPPNVIEIRGAPGNAVWIILGDHCVQYDVLNRGQLTKRHLVRHTELGDADLGDEARRTGAGAP